MKEKAKDHRFINVLIAVLVILLAASPLFAEPEGKKRARHGGPGKKTGQVKLTKEKINSILERIETKRPERAKHLRKLRKEDPKEFKKQIRKIAKNWASRNKQHKKDFADGPKKQQRPQRGKKGRQMKDRPGAFQSCPLANADAPPLLLSSV